MPRLASLAFIAATGAACWLAMMTVHELGHVLAAWASGGTVVEVVLHPLAISRTDLSENPHPAFVSLAGPAFGSIIPVVVWGIAAAAGCRAVFLARFFAGFCLIANGTYLASVIGMPVGDAEDLLSLGVPRWPLASAGLVSAIAGAALWNGTGAGFGLDGRPLDRCAVIATSATIVTLIAGMLLWSWLT